jgi:dihydrodipicolinate reductase
MKIILIGSGNLANEIMRYFLGKGIIVLDSDTELLDVDFIVYAGSEKNVKKVTNISKQKNIPIVLLSTNIDINKFKDCKTLVFENTSLEVLKFIETVEFFVKENIFTNVKIIESHQKNKKDVSATAIKMCNILNISEDSIVSIRDEQEQLSLGITKEFMSGHAYHKISFENQGVLTNFEITVLGRETYAIGLLKILQNLK